MLILNKVFTWSYSSEVTVTWPYLFTNATHALIT
jgi:hypothetical protein